MAEIGTILEVRGTEKAPGRKIVWTLTAESFDRLLANFDSDRERAGERYEQLRRTLTTFFDWRGCRLPEDLADETLNRAARRLEEGEEIRNLADYCHGVARRMVMEVIPKQRKTEEDADDFKHVAAPVIDWEERQEKESHFEFLEKCLSQLSSDQRELILSYYKTEKRAKIDNRITLAESLGLNLNGLRVRVHRIRARLENCLNECVGRQTTN